MISVIVPVYNAEKHLCRCIDSILAQTMSDFELLLINDGSKDNSGTICDEYATRDYRISVFHKENGGASSARNVGLDKAKGEWIAFIDSDDYVLSTFLSTHVQLIQDGADLCVLGIIPDYSISEEFRITKSSFNYNGDIQTYLLLNDCQMGGSLCNKLFKSSIIKEKGLRLNESFKFREDEEFLLRYMQHTNSIVATSKQCYVYLISSVIKYVDAYNLETYISMYRSVVKIYDGKANYVTDSYQTELCHEWLASLKTDTKRAIKTMPRIIRVIGKRIFRIAPFRATYHKIAEFIKK